MSKKPLPPLMHFLSFYGEQSESDCPYGSRICSLLYGAFEAAAHFGPDDAVEQLQKADALMAHQVGSAPVLTPVIHSPSVKASTSSVADARTPHALIAAAWNLLEPGADCTPDKMDEDWRVAALNLAFLAMSKLQEQV